MRLLVKAKRMMTMENLDAYRREFGRQIDSGICVIPDEFDYEVIPDNQWVPRKIIEPEDFRDILFSDINGITYAGTKDSLGQYINTSGEKVEGVVAWMPAPEPYRG